MILGTAGFTAALAVDKFEASGMRPNGGPVLVTGRHRRCRFGGSDVARAARVRSCRSDRQVGRARLPQNLGANEMLGRDALREGANRPMLKERWGGAVDTVGGDLLFNAVKSLAMAAASRRVDWLRPPRSPRRCFRSFCGTSIFSASTQCSCRCPRRRGSGTNSRVRGNWIASTHSRSTSRWTRYPPASIEFSPAEWLVAAFWTFARKQ